MKDMLPLTHGIIASAMLRSNHGVFMNGDDPVMAIFMGDPEQRTRDALRTVLDEYDRACRGEPVDVQIMEEYDGTGFYRTDLEAQYAGMLNSFPGLFEAISEEIAKRKGLRG